MTPSTRTVLQVLPRARLLELARAFSVLVPPDATRDAQVELLAASGKLPFRDVLGALAREELKSACRQHGLDDSGRARAALAGRLLAARGSPESAPPRSLFSAREVQRYAPRAGDLVQLRHRQWLVERVDPPAQEGQATRVALACLDDDAQGARTEALWELELGARVLAPEAHGLGVVDRVDPPRHFAAYLHALKWSSVTATDARLFQAPFRAGLKLLAHQLTPLRKALSLPRANVFIADDVGLGKTIEAGLVMQELLLRQRVEFLLVVCPAAVCLQWRDEMQKRFGLYFEVMSRAFLGRRRQERGFGVNPWSTHTRFLVSHQLLRRPEYRDSLLAHLGERARRSLLVLDEAHVAAPASAQRYAVDSRITEVLRDLAPRFENRLFLSATPHNGHSNSFSALLELLDPQRFTRGVPVRRGQLEAVMVRRLKADLRGLHVEQFPERVLCELALSHEGDQWTAQRSTSVADAPPVREPPYALPEGRPVELELAASLSEYTRLVRPSRGVGTLVFLNLQKRLLSSVEAFHRTLQAHARSVAEGRARTAVLLPTQARDEDEYGPEDEALDASDEARVAAASESLESPNAQARALLDQMLALSAQSRGAPDAKVRALLEWIRKNQCAAVQAGGASPKATRAEKQWSGTRVLLFTEYGDTQRYLLQLLQTAVEGTHLGEQRVLRFHGGMSDEQREEVQRAFNAPPEEHPVRILVVTDAAREGVNLQGHCADLFHFDIPWNPGRLEQRNGRIDRTLQPSPQVRCYYFHYAQRTEDAVLQKLVRKVDVIQRELGSLGSVLLERFESVLEGGIDAQTSLLLDEAEELGGRKGVVTEELESQRRARKLLEDEIEENGAILDKSAAVLDFKPALLRDALDVGLELAGAPPLAPVPVAEPHTEAFALPAMPESWQDTLDSLRPARGRDEPFWEFRKRAPLPLVFRAPSRMNSALAHVHLSHPLVQRVLGRFLSQGYSAQDLSRVTVVRTQHDALVRVLAFGRLSLFGHGATRLHDQLVSVAARWIEGREQELKPFADEADRKALAMLEQVLAEAPTLEAASPALQRRVAEVAPRLFASLWPHVRDEADARALECEQALTRRGAEESAALTELLRGQRMAIIAEVESRAQLTFDDLARFDKREEEQWKKDRAWLDDRLVAIQTELGREPALVREGYRVALRRLEPVGLVVLWPETRG